MNSKPVVEWVGVALVVALFVLAIAAILRLAVLMWQ